MARSEITGKRRLAAQNVSHSNIKTKRWQNVNVQRRRLWVPELGRHVTLKLTTGDLIFKQVGSQPVYDLSTLDLTATERLTGAKIIVSLDESGASAARA